VTQQLLSKELIVRTTKNCIFKTKQQMKNYILTEAVVEKKLQRLALEIAEQNIDETQAIILLGIKQHGLLVAQIIQQHLQKHFPGKIDLIEVSLNKDKPTDIVYSQSIDFNDATIIVIDDVSNSGKTLLYAIKPLLNFHPHKIQTLCLVDRAHKQFGIKPDYVGLLVNTTLQEHIQVEVVDGKIKGAYLV
jgi:pyrimidine operon attenuation protein / uracil phosphoribosyltransferase